MKNNRIAMMLKIELSKKTIRGCITRKVPCGECFVVIPEDKNADKCVVFEENKEGEDKRKFPQFLRKYNIPKQFVVDTMYIINSAFIKKPMDKGNPIKTLLNKAPLTIDGKELFITDITIVSPQSKYYDFREKTTKRVGNKIKHLQKLVKDVEPKITFDTQLSIGDQSYSEKMFDRYEVYGYLDSARKITALTKGEAMFAESKELIKLTFVRNKMVGNYICKEEKLSMSAETMRILNLRIKHSGTLQCESLSKRFRMIYAMPLI